MVKWDWVDYCFAGFFWTLSIMLFVAAIIVVHEVINP